MAERRPVQPQEPEADLQQEANQRLADARRQKSLVDRDIRECYFFIAPHRARDVSSLSSTPSSRPDDARDLQTSLGIEVAQDFATEIANTLMPQAIVWAEQKAGADISEDAWGDVKDQVDAQTTAIHDAVKASNFYSSVAQTLEPDLGVGTVGMWVSDLRPNEATVCQPVPARELEINVGPYGQVDDRFIVRHTRHRHLAALLPGVKLPKEIRDKVKAKPNDRCKVTWGYWRKWDREDDVVWQAVVMVGKTLVDDALLVGEGSCPLLVGRWNPDTMFAWGSGPTMKALPELRRLDETEALKIENADFQIHPPFSYPDDGVTNFAGGIEAGMGYPSRPGNGKDFVKLSFEGNVQFAEYETAQIESRIRRLHFVDYPEQRGKTPPTAEQWLEELQRTKKRIGTPGTVFWREFPAAVFLRFKWLLERRGKIEPIKIDGKVLSLAPYDPTEIAQDQQESMVAMRFTQWGMSTFPQTWEVAVDQQKTLTNMKTKLRDKIVVLRSEEDMLKAVQQLAPALGQGGGIGGAPAPGPAGAPPEGPPA